MRILPRLLVLAGLIWLAVVLILQALEMWNLEPGAPGYDPTVIVLYFMGIVALALAIGVVFASMILPAIGDSIGHFFFTPNEQIEKEPHADALAFYNQGEYEGAVAAYRNVVRKNPNDTHAISEVARILCERLERPEEAAEYLQEQLEREWEMDQQAFLAERLVDVYWLHLQDSESSMVILRQIAELFPETTHSANANHRIRLIEEALFKQQMEARQAAEDPASSEDLSSMDPPDRPQPEDSSDS